MGNHAVGRAMVAIAETLAARRLPDETAMAILDIAADKSEIRGADAEFDDAPYEEGPFRSLLIEAFGEPGEIYDDEIDDGDGFYEGVYRHFRERYSLC